MGNNVGRTNKFWSRHWRVGQGQRILRQTKLDKDTLMSGVENPIWKYLTNLRPLHRWDWVPVIIALQAFPWVEKMEPFQVCFTLHLRDQQSKMQDGCKVYMDSYMSSSWSCFMIIWTNFKNNLLEVGLTQTQETLTLQNFTTIGLFYFIMCKDPTWILIHWNNIWLRARSHMTTHYTWRPLTTLHGFGGVWG